jgi:adenylate cyclase
MKSFKIKRYVTGLIVTSIVAITLCACLASNLFYGLQLQSSDFLFRAAKSNEMTSLSKTVTVIGIDDKSLEKLGRFTSWPRSYYASVIDTLTEAKSRVIVLDVLFSEPATGDEELSKSIARAGNVIMPFVAVSAADRIYDGQDLNGNLLTTLQPLPLLQGPSAASGYANVSADRDGVVREAPVILNINGADETSLALAAVQRYLRLPSGKNYDLKGNLFLFAGRAIPLDEGNRMVINFLGPEMGGALKFECISILDVLERKFDSSIFRDKIVLIGATATGISDKYWTPMGYTVNGVEIHGYTVQTILSASYFSHVPSYITFLIIILLSLLSAAVMLHFRLLIAIPVVILIFIGYFAAVFLYFDRGIMLNVFYPPLSIVLAVGGISLTNFVSEKSGREEVTRIFGRFVTAPVVTEILAASDRGQLKLGGSEQVVTIMFADIRGFTTIMEKTPSDSVVDTLNKYLSTVIDSVMKYQGVINKFGGDSVMAIWNAPVPCDQHPLMAVRAACEAQLAIKRVKELELDLINMSFGIGINTGLALAGNMGCQSRLEYSVIGDSVNIAARLTGITPGGKIWISKSTYEYIMNSINATYVDSIIFKGKEETITVYEVIDIKDEI